MWVCALLGDVGRHAFWWRRGVAVGSCVVGVGFKHFHNVEAFGSIVGFVELEGDGLAVNVSDSTSGD